MIYLMPLPSQVLWSGPRGEETLWRGEVWSAERVGRRSILRLGLLRLLRLRVDHLVLLDAVVRRPDGRDVESRGHEWVIHCDGGRGQVGVGAEYVGGRLGLGTRRSAPVLL